MDSTMTWGIIGLIVGLIVGALIVWLVIARRTHEPSVSQLKAENERFREEVNAHFVQSAQLINELTDSYKKVFDHLSDGAERLVDKDTTRDRMPQVGRQEVRLRHIGAPKDHGVTATSKNAPRSAPAAKSQDDADDNSV